MDMSPIQRLDAAGIDIADVRIRLANFTSPEAAQAYMDSLCLDATQAADLAAAMDVPTPRARTTQDVVDQVIAVTVTGRLDHTPHRPPPPAPAPPFHAMAETATADQLAAARRALVERHMVGRDESRRAETEQTVAGLPAHKIVEMVHRVTPWDEFTEAVTVDRYETVAAGATGEQLLAARAEIIEQQLLGEAPANRDTARGSAITALTSMPDGDVVRWVDEEMGGWDEFTDAFAEVGMNPDITYVSQIVTETARSTPIDQLTGLVAVYDQQIERIETIAVDLSSRDKAGASKLRAEARDLRTRKAETETQIACHPDAAPDVAWKAAEAADSWLGSDISTDVMWRARDRYADHLAGTLTDTEIGQVRAMADDVGYDGGDLAVDEAVRIVLVQHDGIDKFLDNRDTPRPLTAVEADKLAGNETTVNETAAGRQWLTEHDGPVDAVGDCTVVLRVDRAYPGGWQKFVADHAPDPAVDAEPVPVDALTYRVNPETGDWAPVLDDDEPVQVADGERVAWDRVEDARFWLAEHEVPAADHPVFADAPDRHIAHGDAVNDAVKRTADMTPGQVAAAVDAAHPDGWTGFNAEQNNIDTALDHAATRPFTPPKPPPDPDYEARTLLVGVGVTPTDETVEFVKAQAVRLTEASGYEVEERPEYRPPVEHVDGILDKFQQRRDLEDEIDGYYAEREEVIERMLPARAIDFDFDHCDEPVVPLSVAKEAARDVVRVDYNLANTQTKLSQLTEYTRLDIRDALRDGVPAETIEAATDFYGLRGARSGDNLTPGEQLRVETGAVDPSYVSPTVASTLALVETTAGTAHPDPEVADAARAVVEHLEPVQPTPPPLEPPPAAPECGPEPGAAP